MERVSGHLQLRRLRLCIEVAAEQHRRLPGWSGGFAAAGLPLDRVRAVRRLRLLRDAVRQAVHQLLRLLVPICSVTKYRTEVAQLQTCWNLTEHVIAGGGASVPLWAATSQGGGQSCIRRCGR